MVSRTKGIMSKDKDKETDNLIIQIIENMLDCGKTENRMVMENYFKTTN
jgi:hypothetical protein